MICGVLCCDKPSGPTSHQLVALARKALGTRDVGHAGTLDPMASGLLVLGVGQGLKVLRCLVLDDKVYEATVQLGVETNTLDAQGQVSETAPVPEGLTRARVESACRSFVGRQRQRAPVVSALKQAGVRLHVRARRGERVEAPEREVVVYALEVGTVTADRIDLVVHCGKGFYVRALARDLARALGTVGHLAALRRTRSGSLVVSGSADVNLLRAAMTDATARELLAQRVLPIREALATVPCVTLDAAGSEDARHGRAIALERVRAASEEAQTTEPILLCDEAGTPLALGRLKDGSYRVVRGLVYNDSR